MEIAPVPTQPYPQTPEMTGQPAVYPHDQTAQHPQQKAYVASPDQNAPQAAQVPAQQTQPGMPAQPSSGIVYRNATPLENLQRGPAPADCPACGQRAMTNTAYETGNTTHAWAFGLCCCFCLGCIPYVMNSLKDVRHKCGRCGVLLATWHRSGTTEVHMHS